MEHAKPYVGCGVVDRKTVKEEAQIVMKVLARKCVTFVFHLLYSNRLLRSHPKVNVNDNVGIELDSVDIKAGLLHNL